MNGDDIKKVKCSVQSTESNQIKTSAALIGIDPFKKHLIECKNNNNSYFQPHLNTHSQF